MKAGRTTSRAGAVIPVVGSLVSSSVSISAAKIVRPPSYVVWATLTHPSRSWAVGYEIRPGYLKVVAYAESKLPADSLAKRLGDGIVALTGIGSANSLAPVLPSISVLQALKSAQLLADSFAAAQTEKQMSLMVTIPATGTGVHKARFKNHQYSWAWVRVIALLRLLEIFSGPIRLGLTLGPI